MTSIIETGKLPELELPIPADQLFYPDRTNNPQLKPIAQFIDYVHYPTLGCPALLGPENRLQVMLSLPTSVDYASLTFHLVDRHRQQGSTFELHFDGDPTEIARSPGGDRRLIHLWFRMDNAPFALFDLQVSFDGVKEVQYNAVQRYRDITGSEQVLFCGDSQYHVDNRACLEKFIQRVNSLDVAWIAIIGDICDNGVKGWRNILKLAASAEPTPVTHYYNREYREAHELLRTLRHPVLLCPGNHDGMSAYAGYNEGIPSEVYTGPDTLNAVEYDGLHHFRCTFGPLYFSFDWAGTRYLFTNTFELTRNQRLGYHAIVANWGGWMRPPQVNWIKKKLEEAKGMRKVLLMHHDPRGGSEGVNLGHYHRMRNYTFDHKWPILKAYLSYAIRHGRTKWQQEWMAPAHGDVADHPVQHLLRTALENDLWAVIMGHDNENWVDSYFQGDELFLTEPSSIRYATRADIDDEELVDNIIDYLEVANYQELSSFLETKDETAVEAAMSAALDEMERAAEPANVMFVANPAESWGLEVKSAIHFVHVDDIGSYKYSEESDFDDYGYVLATLDGGAPVRVQSHRISGRTGIVRNLEVD